MHQCRGLVPLRCKVFARLNNCANCDEADALFVQTQKNAKSLLPWEKLTQQKDYGRQYGTLLHSYWTGHRSTQPDSHYIRYTAASVLRRTTLSTPEGHWLTCTTVSTPQWHWMCSPGRQWQGTFDCPLPWGTSMALGCHVPTVGRCSTTVAHYGTTLQSTCSY